MRTVWAIARKEIGTYVGSPIAYVVAVVFLAPVGLLFALDLGGAFPEASLRGFLQPGLSLLAVGCPLLTMRLLSEEQKMGTLELLLTAPVRDAEVVLGKFLGSFLVILGILALTFYFPLLLFVFGDPDVLPIVTGYLALILAGATALAIGLFGSSLTSNQIVAAVLSLGIILLLLVATPAALFFQGFLSDLLAYLGLLAHTSDLLLGIFDTRHLFYFLSLIAFFLFITIRMLESRRWR